MTNFDKGTCNWRVRLNEETLESEIEHAKKFVSTVELDDEPEEEEKTVKFSIIRVAIQMINEQRQFCSE